MSIILHGVTFSVFCLPLIFYCDMTPDDLISGAYLKVGWMEWDHPLGVVDGMLEERQLKGIFRTDII